MNDHKNFLKVLHITPHLGGGVGKALSSLVEVSIGSNVTHNFLLLETPQKKQFLNKIIKLGSNVYVKPGEKISKQIIEETDIVQLEWWNHPATFKFLCDKDFPEMRLVIWCHVSGLHYPLIPKGLFNLARCFLFTSACSLEVANYYTFDEEIKSRLGVVSSGVGFKFKKSKKFDLHAPFRFGYIGSLNFSKLHPQFINYLAGVTLKNFKVDIWGDDFHIKTLVSQCNVIGKPNLIKYNGYTIEPEIILSDLDVFIYLLTPIHYGTAENSLMEAMSLGVVPIVLDNPAETCIVDHGQNGFVVKNKDEFVSVINYLAGNPAKLRRMSKNAKRKISQHYSPNKMMKTMNSYYEKVMTFQKCITNFRTALGNEPYDWYMACQEKTNSFIKTYGTGNYEMFETTKGSINHFLSYFPEDIKLKELAVSKVA